MGSKTEAPSLPPIPRGRSCAVVTVTLVGSYQPNENIMQAAAEGIIEGFGPGIEKTVSGMVPACGEGEGRGRGAENILKILLDIYQRNDFCTPLLSAKEVSQTINTNKADIIENVVKHIGIVLAVEEVLLIEEPSAAPTMSMKPTPLRLPPPSTTAAPLLSPTLNPAMPEARAFFIKSTFPGFNEGVPTRPNKRHLVAAVNNA